MTLEAIKHVLDIHDKKLQKLEEEVDSLKCNVSDTNHLLKMIELEMKGVKEAVTSRAQFWDKVKVSVTTSVILFIIMWIVNRSQIFV